MFLGNGKTTDVISTILYNDDTDKIQWQSNYVFECFISIYVTKAEGQQPLFSSYFMLCNEGV